jgi:hypothetical protein
MSDIRRIDFHGDREPDRLGSNQRSVRRISFDHLGDRYIEGAQYRLGFR